MWLYEGSQKFIETNEINRDIEGHEGFSVSKVGTLNSKKPYTVNSKP